MFFLQVFATRDTWALGVVGKSREQAGRHMTDRAIQSVNSSFVVY